MPGGAVTERELLEGCRKGDRDALAELVRRHQRELFGTVLRLVGRRAIAEEIVQDAFLRTLGRIDHIDPERGARRWMLGVAVNLVREHYRQAKRIVAAPEIPEQAEVLFGGATDETPEHRLISSEERRQYLTALDRLPHHLREILILHHVDELPFGEIAAMLRVPATTLRMRAVRARNRLMKLLQETP